MGLFLVKEIKSKAGELHFRRWRFLETPWFGIYLHYIAKADEDKHPHDHPWSFVGIILWGGYEEFVCVPDFRGLGIKPEGKAWGLSWRGFYRLPPKNGGFRPSMETVNTPGTISYRSATGIYHQITRLLKPTWTLVFHGPKRPGYGPDGRINWGYFTDDGWMDHETYRQEKRKGRWD